MKCAVFHGRHQLRVEEREIPAVGPGQVLVQVKACGVCGTDVHIYEGDKGAANCPPGTVLGHEFSGVVEQTGEGVSRVKPGDRVCVDPNKLCGQCCYCQSGIGHFCESMVGIGTTVDGGFAQYCLVPQSQVYLIGEGIRFEEAAMAEPVSCCLHGIDLCEIGPGSRVAVIGGGMIGLIMLQLARLAGASFTALLEPVAEKRAMAQRLGADLVVDPFHEDAAQRLREAGVSRLDAVIECAGLPSTIAQAIELAGKRSVVMMFGLTKPDDTVAIKPFEIFQKEVVLKASYINPYTMGRAVELINRRRLDVSSMVCETAPLSMLEEILASPALRAKGKYIIDPWK
ncbi:MAG TPA: zinc-dependent alcohol dehydrogenase family protein [Candidatus Caccousia avistercoris]|nr:zinc-dependent alcohol dehydrogenase family protein [Candidatus Caccousia avistercoris]